MISRIRFWAGLVCAMIAAIWWAVGITVIQPLVEPIEHAENNTYWSRDVRWLALLAIVLAFVWSFRGDRRLSAMAAGALVVGFGADLALDRFDDAFMTEQFDFVESSSVRWGVYLVVILVPGAWIRAKFQPIKPDPRISVLAASIAAAAAVTAAGATSPTDTEWPLLPSALLLGGVLTAAALGNAATAAGAATTSIRVTAVVGFAAALALIAAQRATWPEPGTATHTLVLLGLALLTVEVLTVALLATAGRETWRRLTAVFGALLTTGLSLVVVAILSITLNTGAVLTSLAGNPAVDSADSDTLNTLNALCSGALIGACLLGVLAIAAPATRPLATEPA